MAGVRQRDTAVSILGHLTQGPVDLSPQGPGPEVAAFQMDSSLPRPEKVKLLMDEYKIPEAQAEALLPGDE